jgi:mono/diheme cytochrome c family protein
MASGGKARQAARLGAVLAAVLIAGCDRPEPPAHLRIASGDAERGRLLIQRYECGVCHRIEGVRGAGGIVGPPLTDYAQRVVLAGIVPNAPRTLVPWLMNPPAMAPNTAMPDLGISEPEARDIASYLYTLGAGSVRVWPPAALPLRGPQGLAGEGAPAGDRPARDSAAIERAMERLLRKEPQQ